MPLSSPTSFLSDVRVQAPAIVVVALVSTPPAVPSSTALLFCERSLSGRAAIRAYDRDCSYLI